MSAVCKSIYVHVPFCQSLCGYCDFFSQIPAPGQITATTDALIEELEIYARRLPLAADTVYVGGGTPTVLPPGQLARLLKSLGRMTQPGASVEFTVEANPATVSPHIADVLVQAGVNRVSIGAQSFAPAELRTLDRRHTPADVARTVARCRAAGCAQISLDLIFGIPGQTPASWQASLHAALELGPDHLSCYGLTFEPGTPLHARRAAGLVQCVDEDVEAEMYETALDVLPAAGLGHYEISNFARAGAECRHNVRYWRSEPCLGLGPSAAGYVDGVRYKNVADVRAYVETIQRGRLPRSEEECLSAEHRARESAMLGLRLTAGIDRAQFAQRYGADPVELFAEAVARHVAGGLLEVSASSVRLTRRGLLLANDVMVDFL